MGKVETVAEEFYTHKVNKILAKILNSLKHHLDTPNFNYYSSHLLSLGCLCRGQDTAIMKLANFTFSKKKHTQTHTQLLVNFSTQNNSKSVKINEQQFNKIYIPYIIEKQDESISLRQKATMKHCKFISKPSYLFHPIFLETTFLGLIPR